MNESSLQIYSRCPTCGIEGLKIRQIQRDFMGAEIHKTETEKDRAKHKKLIAKGKLKGYGLFGVVVLNGKISKLTEWN